MTAPTGAVTVAPTPQVMMSSQPPTVIATSSAENVLTAQDAGVIIGAQEVVTSDSGVTMRFTVTAKEGQEFPKDGVRIAVDTAKLGLVSGEQLLLYRVRDDQFGQAERIDTAQTASRTTQGLTVPEFLIPAIGDFLLAGSERFPFINDTLEMIALDKVEYGIFPIEGNGVIGSTTTGQDQSPMTLKLGSYVRGRPSWTRDEAFPVKVNVFIHHGSGSDHRSASYSFSEWVEYNNTQSPRRGELAATVRGYYLDRWNTRLSPDAGAEKFNTNRTTQFDPGTPWIHISHSAGCNVATCIWSREDSVYADNGGYMRYNDLGRIELAPARGGSQLETPDLIYATISKQHRPVLLSVAYLIRLRDVGELTFSGTRMSITELLTGKPLTLLNENGRTLAWDGRGVGFPLNMTYQWFAFDDVTFPYFQKRITEAAKFRATPCGDGIPTDLRYIDLRTGECFYNYAQKIDSLENWYKTESIGGRDAIAGYVPKIDPKTIEKAENTVLSPKSLRYAMSDSSDWGFKEKFERDALPFGCFLIAKSPSLTSNDPLPNENVLCDCAVGVAQQLNLKEGRSILSAGSTYTNYGIDMGAVHERLPTSIRKFEILQMNHIDAATGSPATWDLMDRYLLERTQKLRDEENNLVITDEDKRILRETFVPAGNKDWFKYDLDVEHYRYRQQKVYYFYPDAFTYTQDPLDTKQKNRVRVQGSGRTIIGIEWWDDYWNDYRENLSGGGASSERWSINRDFIKRNGRWHIVRVAGE